LIITKRRGSYVRGHHATKTVHIDQGIISARMPTDPERRAMHLDVGVPILIITRLGQNEELHPADRTKISITGLAITDITNSGGESGNG
jgi:DNA-binding GntR family transcriptional regulator